MQAAEWYDATGQDQGNISGGRILLIDDDAEALEARSASLRREGHEVRAYASFPEGLSHLDSEHFDLIMVKLKDVPGIDNEEFWTVKSRSTIGGPSSWHAASIGLVTWMWHTWEIWTN